MADVISRGDRHILQELKALMADPKLWRGDAPADTETCARLLKEAAERAKATGSDTLEIASVDLPAGLEQREHERVRLSKGITVIYTIGWADGRVYRHASLSRRGGTLTEASVRQITRVLDVDAEPLENPSSGVWHVFQSINLLGTTGEA